MVSKKKEYDEKRKYYQIYQKEWDSLTWIQQGGLCKQYRVVFLDHTIKFEKTKKVLRLLTIQNVIKFNKKYRDTLNKVDSVMKEIDKEVKSSLKGFDTIKTTKEQSLF